MEIHWSALLSSCHAVAPKVVWEQKYSVMNLNNAGGIIRGETTTSGVPILMLSHEPLLSGGDSNNLTKNTTALLVPLLMPRYFPLVPLRSTSPQTCQIQLQATSIIQITLNNGGLILCI